MGHERALLRVSFVNRLLYLFVIPGLRLRLVHTMAL